MNTIQRALYDVTLKHMPAALEDESLRTLPDAFVYDGTLPFPRRQYAEYKYGRRSSGLSFGYSMGQMIQEEMVALATDHPIVIMAAPQGVVPTASSLMAEGLWRLLTLRFHDAGLLPPRLETFHKGAIGSLAYATKSQTDRIAEIESLKIWADPQSVRGSVVLALDDMYVTGTAQRVAGRVLESLEPAMIYYLPVVRIDPTVAAKVPLVENEINLSYPPSLEHMLELIEMDDFSFISRALLFVLQQKDHPGLRRFLMEIPATLLEQIIFAVYGTGPKFAAENAEFLEQAAKAAYIRNLPMAPKLPTLVRN